MLRFCCWLCLWGLALSSAQAQATLPPELQQKARAEISSRGLDEAAVRARLLTRGIDIDHVTPEQLPSLQAQIEAVLQELEAEKKQEKAATLEQVAETAKATVEESSQTVAKQQSTQVQEKVKQGASVEEALSETLSAEAQKTLPPAQIYGHHLFRDKSLPLFRTTNEVKPPDSYVLSSEDEINLSIFGVSQFESTCTICNKGYIQPIQMPNIFLNATRLTQTTTLIENQYSTT